MKLRFRFRFLLPLLFPLLLPLAALGQITQPPGVLYQSSAPSGTCSEIPPIQVVNSTGAICTCAGGTWACGTGSPGSYAPLNSPAFTGIPTTPTNANASDSSTQIANDAFVQNAVALSMGTVPLNFASVASPVSFDSKGTGQLVSYTTNTGAVSGFTAWIPSTGTNYVVGDVITIQGGNYDSMIQVTGVTSGYVTSGAILYGGTGYSNGTSIAATAANTIPYTFLLSGALANSVSIIMPHGTYLTQSNQWIFADNTTGGPTYTNTVCVAGATDACSGGSTVTLKEGTGNSTSATLQTDGVLNVTLADTPLGIGALPLAGGTMTGAVVFSGSGSGSANAVGTDNSAFGYNALNVSISGTDNTGVGQGALNSLTSGSDNTSIGSGSLAKDTSGGNNTAEGFNALNHTTTGAHNTALGAYALDFIATTSDNTAVGYYSLVYNTSYYNVAIGSSAGEFISGGSTQNTTGIYSTLLGYATEPLANGDSNETVIGSQAIGNGSNTATIGNSSVTATYLGGITMPIVVYTHAGTQLAACASGTLGGEAVVGDAASGGLTPGTAYSVTAGAGSVTVRVQCTLTGSTYAWQTM